ncbi:MAG: ComF family protein [Clostridia bacterium]|nr:ComF family protein [Clostridia bacterium]
MSNAEKILNLFFPPVCGFCNGINKNFLCDDCRKKFKEIAISTIDNYANEPVYFDEHYFLLKYETEVREFILKYKFDEQSYLYKTFARLIIEDKNFKENFIKKYDCIVSVPIHKKRFKTRGYNQSELIARDIAQICEIDFCGNVLIKNKNVVAQSGLDKLSRVSNIKNAFSAGEGAYKLQGKKVAIFDDIFTTGATTNECARVLKMAGVSYVGIFSLAKD